MPPFLDYLHRHLRAACLDWRYVGSIFSREMQEDKSQPLMKEALPWNSLLQSAFPEKVWRPCSFHFILIINAVSVVGGSLVRYLAYGLVLVSENSIKHCSRSFEYREQLSKISWQHLYGVIYFISSWSFEYTVGNSVGLSWRAKTSGLAVPRQSIRCLHLACRLTFFIQSSIHKKAYSHCPQRQYNSSMLLVPLVCGLKQTARIGGYFAWVVPAVALCLHVPSRYLGTPKAQLLVTPTKNQNQTANHRYDATLIHNAVGSCIPVHENPAGFQSLVIGGEPSLEEGKEWPTPRHHTHQLVMPWNLPPGLMLLLPGTTDACYVNEGFLTYDNPRLNLQHYLWKDQTGYLLHPSIPLSNPNIKIADIGTGTGYEALSSPPLLLSTTMR